MRVPLSWLADHVDVDVPVATLAEKLTFAGIEIETIHRVGDDLAGILTARVLEVTQHPDADRLVLVRIETGGEDRQIRLRPSYFPFVEPGAEVDVSCFICGGTGEGCRTCRGEGWIELLGAGMVHPNVLRAGGYDPDEVSGFAAGTGIERPFMLRSGLADMRTLTDNDVRWLTSV